MTATTKTLPPLEMVQRRYDEGANSDGKRLVRVRCDCGFVLRVRIDNMRSGNSASCGCKRWTPHAVEVRG